MFECKAPVALWDYAAEHAVYLKNRAPTDALPYGAIKASTPFEAYKGIKANIKNLRVFGSKAIIKLPNNRHAGKWTPYIKPGSHILVGLRGDSIQKLLDCKTLKDQVSTDCDFNEYEFPELTLP